MAYRIEAVVVVTQFGHMHQAFDENIVKLNKQTEACHRGDRRDKFVADLVLHVFAFQPVDHAITCGIRAPFSHRRVFAEAQHVVHVVRINLGLGQLRRIGLLLYALMLGITDQVTNTAMHEQIWVAPNRRGEVSIRFVPKTEMPYVLGLINRLHHRANQHRLQQMVVWPMRDLLEHRLIIARRRLEPTAHM